MNVRISFPLIAIKEGLSKPPIPTEIGEIAKSIHYKVDNTDISLDFMPQKDMWFEVLDFSKDFDFTEQEIDFLKDEVFMITELTVRKGYLEIELV